MVTEQEMGTEPETVPVPEMDEQEMERLLQEFEAERKMRELRAGKRELDLQEELRYALCLMGAARKEIVKRIEGRAMASGGANVSAEMAALHYLAGAEWKVDALLWDRAMED